MTWSIEINWLSKKSLCIVVCSKGYPDNFNKDIEIENLKNIKLDNNEYLFHAGTSINNKNEYITSGGRILNVVGFGDTLDKAISDAYRIVDKIKFKNMHYRKDIGKKGLNC